MCAAQGAKDLRGRPLDARAVLSRRAVLLRRRACELHGALFLLGEARKFRQLCAAIDAVAHEKCRAHEEHALDARRTHDFAVEEQCRHEEMGAAFRDGAARHELLRRQPREGVEEAQEVLALYERIRAFRARREERGDGARFESREHEMANRMMLDARPERREGRVDVVAHGRGKGQALAFLLAEMLKDAQAAARDVLLKEQPAPLPAREAESARRDVHEQHGLFAKVLRVLQKLVTQGKELVVDLLRHVGDFNRKACADANLIEDAEAIFRLAQDGRADGEDLRHAVVGEKPAKACKDAAKLADRVKGEPPVTEHLLAEPRLPAYALDDLDIVERGE